MDWACWRFAALTPRDSCRASFRPNVEKLGAGRRHWRACTTRRGASLRCSRWCELLPTKCLRCCRASSLGAVAQRLRKFMLRAKVRHRRRLGYLLRTRQRGHGATTWHRAASPGATRRLLLAPRDRLGEFDVADAAASARWETRRHRCRTAAGLRADQRSFRGADAESRLVRRHRLRQGLLHRARKSSRAPIIAAA